MSSEREGIKSEGEEQMPMSHPGYLVVRHDKGGVVDLLLSLVSWNRLREVFLEEQSSDGVSVEPDHRWVILVSIVIRKIIALFGKPMELVGLVVEFFLNLLSQNGGFLGLIVNLLTVRVIIPQKGSQTYISTIGHLDGRINLYQSDLLDVILRERNLSGTTIPIESNALMDLCVMASKLSYENANVVCNVIVDHWKMHFVDFCNCWNEYQKERSTQVFILSDKPKDANLILISFRGTEPFDADDWITDWDYSWYEIPELGRVHMGFLEALGLGNRDEPSSFIVRLQQDYELRALDDETTAYYTVRSKLHSLLDKNKKAQFIVTGHSLGGALAILFPALLMFHKEDGLVNKLLGVYTFGQPRVGDGQLRRFMESHMCHPVTKYFRMVYCNDLVPRLPYDDVTFFYKHFGLCLYFNSFYKEQDVEEVPNKNYFRKRYFIQYHLNAAWELVRGIFMGYTHGPEYKEGWFSILLRISGLVLPGISAHSPREYVNCVRLGRRIVHMSSL